MKKWLISIVGMLLLGGVTLIYAEGEITGAKALFYNPNTAVSTGVYEGNVVINPDSGGRSTVSASREGASGGATQGVAYSGEISGFYDRLSNPGVNYWIELARPGTSNLKRVTDRHIFKSGDKIRIHVAGNANGHLYALHRGSTGREMVLPVSSAGGGSAIGAGTDYVIPSAGGWLLFDHNKGIEEVKFLFAPKENGRERVPTQGERDPQMLFALHHQYSASKGLIQNIEMGTKDLLAVNAGGTQVSYDVPVNRHSTSFLPVNRELVEAPGTYAINTMGEPVAVTVELRHQ